ncbi:MAG: VanZ family protein [Woeseia sp.]
MTLSMRLLLTLLFMGLLLALSVVPGRAQQGDSAFVWFVAATPAPVQKVMHLVLYALLAFLWAWTLSAVESLAVRLAASLIIAIAWGALLEWSQTRIPGRFGTLMDALLNAAGALLGILAALLLL